MAGRCLLTPWVTRFVGSLSTLVTGTDANPIMITRWVGALYRFTSGNIPGSADNQSDTAVDYDGVAPTMPPECPLSTGISTRDTDGIQPSTVAGI